MFPIPLYGSPCTQVESRLSRSPPDHSIPILVANAFLRIILPIDPQSMFEIVLPLSVCFGTIVLVIFDISFQTQTLIVGFADVGDYAIPRLSIDTYHDSMTQ